ncbi:MAG TPA: heme exporter protein CcmD [Steroidobacteraceae bacterium]|nr:heme exporter protein CcmD [Steroidobacteraceae bacterium]
MNEFLAMSGYGKYLWPSFGLVIGIVVLNLVLAWNSLKAAQAQAKRRLEMQS